MSDNKIIQIGDIVRYKHPYPDESGSTYKVLDVWYIESNGKVEMEYICKMSIKPLFTAFFEELEVIK
jgi:hypothetical protein